MNRSSLVACLFFVAIVATSGCGERKVVFSEGMLGAPLPRESWPKDCDQAATMVIEALPKLHRRTFGGEGPATLNMLNGQDGLGGAVRARFGLASGNDLLIRSCVPVSGSAASASLEIMTRASVRLRR